MRITGGTAKGRSLSAPKKGNRSIRPTSDRTREALFSIIADCVPGSRVLDLYAGTGALGIESLSRGADLAVFIDKSFQSLKIVQTNLTRCFASPQAALHKINLTRTDAIKNLQRKLPDDFRFSLVFLDPPYEKKLAEMTLQMVDRAGIVQKNGLVIVEERKNEQLPEQCGSLKLVDQRQYGETGLWFYKSSGETFGQHTSTFPAGQRLTP